MQLRGPFDGFVEKAVRASTTCLIMADRNRYSINARAACAVGGGALREADGGLHHDNAEKRGGPGF
ncbi:hypothetical protein BH10PSE7_BH10PSE7_31460 [soil metagenome]